MVLNFNNDRTKTNPALNQNIQIFANLEQVQFAWEKSECD